MERNDVSSFFYYMWNAWNESECEMIFRECGWLHFWEKYGEFYDRYGVHCVEQFFMSLSEDNKDRLVKRACELYDRGEKIGANASFPVNHI